MSLIKGVDILLFNGDTSETVRNILVGQPATSGTADISDDWGTLREYTLAIPKGDTHDWVNRIVSFWGQTFRTVGYPLQGIEELMPLDWHKQVKVRQINVNGTCVIYDKETYTRHAYGSVYFFDERSNVPQTGSMSTEKDLNVHIFADKSVESIYQPKIGDIITIGECEFEFDTSTQQALSESMTEFRGEYRYALIREVQSISFGDIPDYVIKAV